MCGVVDDGKRGARLALCSFIEDDCALLQGEGALVKPEVVFSTPFFDVVAKPMASSTVPHFSLRTTDYVSVLALTDEGRVPLVRQLRPAVDRFTLEIPSGTQDPGESTEETARRELLEESGYRAGTVELLGRLRPDTGRLGNSLWCYFASDLSPVDDTAIVEEGIERVELTPAEVMDCVRCGEMDHALHVAVLLLGVQHGYLSPDLLRGAEG